MHNGIHVSVVIPAFNEEGSIGPLLDGVHGVLKKMNLQYEIIVVNDGSVDRTGEIAKNHDVVLVDGSENLGKGNAVRKGLLRARGQILVTMDADGSHYPGDIRMLLDPLLNREDIDAVVGVRFHSLEGKRSTARLHLVGNKIINAVVLFLTGRHVTDTQSGFRAFREDVLRELTLSSSGYEIESEVIVKLLRNSFRIEELPIQCGRRVAGNTKIHSFRDGFRILKAILKATFSS